MLYSMIIILAWEITAGHTGACCVPAWLDDRYSKVCDFWQKLFF